MRTLYLVSKRLPRVCMDGSPIQILVGTGTASAPRVHGWFREESREQILDTVCPACAWMVPSKPAAGSTSNRLPRVCMGGSFRGTG